MNQQHHRSKYSRQMHDSGIGYRRIGKTLGIPWLTIREWCAYRTRYKVT